MGTYCYNFFLFFFLPRCLKIVNASLSAIKFMCDFYRRTIQSRYTPSLSYIYFNINNKIHLRSTHTVKKSLIYILYKANTWKPSFDCMGYIMYRVDRDFLTQSAFIINLHEIARFFLNTRYLFVFIISRLCCIERPFLKLVHKHHPKILIILIARKPPVGSRSDNILRAIEMRGDVFSCGFKF